MRSCLRRSRLTRETHIRNFYIVTNYNLHHATVKSLLEKIKLTAITQSMVDFKVRSKLFTSFGEAKFYAEEDFDKKLPVLYEGEHPQIKEITVMNPAFVITGTPGIDQFIGTWDNNCCGAIFICENKEADDEEEDDKIPTSWMFKYEIYFVEDPIEISKNGDFAFNSANIVSSYH